MGKRIIFGLTALIVALGIGHHGVKAIKDKTDFDFNDTPKSYTQMLEENNDNTMVDELIAQGRVVTTSIGDKPMKEAIDLIDSSIVSNNVINELEDSDKTIVISLTEEEENKVLDEWSSYRERGVDYKSVLLEQLNDENLNGFEKAYIIECIKYVQRTESVLTPEESLKITKELVELQLNSAALEVLGVKDCKKVDEYEFDYSIESGIFGTKHVEIQVSDPRITTENSYGETGLYTETAVIEPKKYLELMKSYDSIVDSENAYSPSDEKSRMLTEMALEDAKEALTVDPAKKYIYR